MEELLRQLLSGQNDLKNDIKQMKSDITNDIEQMKSDITEIKTAVHRIELSQPQDITALLDRMNKNLEHKMEVLNKRVFNVEAEIERLNKQ
ncbi:hypothetical protein [Aquibacillus albus]|uniref:Nucleic acid-binding Zn-ribbon protein n=1 Tax=Aquibacillus albus TaxID=1168171 RepID=A0ABS2MZN5_9BACI|nr:hypothetical protein [Aquibacillus albus]MBM7571354.1 putative nucleic acid-binding Zn-ribbon protein [Aquibacillus albus]